MLLCDSSVNKAFSNQCGYRHYPISHFVQIICGDISFYCIFFFTQNVTLYTS